MRGFLDFFRVDGQPLLVPDADVTLSREDIDSEDSGRDANAVMHRIVLRQGVLRWSFSYESISEQERQYMEGLFQGKTVFDFVHPDWIDPQVERCCRAYRSEVGIGWHDARMGQWKNYRFDIVEC